MADDSTKKTLIVALGVCLVCSVLVSTAAVGLKGIQKSNQKKDKLKNILMAGDLMQEGTDIEALFAKRIRAEVINLETGKPMNPADLDEEVKPEKFDVKEVSKSAKYTKPIPVDIDRADIKRKPKFMVVYKVMKGDSLIKWILPLYGKGLWSTMYGFIALDQDLRTIKGFTFYDQGETPGLGGEVDNPKWKALWKNKLAFDTDGNVIIHVIKGKVDRNSPQAKYEIDGLSGSTLTTRGVDHLVRFWLGEHGYGPFFANLRGEG